MRGSAYVGGVKGPSAEFLAQMGQMSRQRRAVISLRKLAALPKKLLERSLTYVGF